jgi:hypothetical protein
MPAKYVRPYSKGQKNNFRDAEAIAEAVQRPAMKFVATKTADQLDLQALHRVRELASGRTGIINQIHAFLLERGVTLKASMHAFDELLDGEILYARCAGPRSSSKLAASLQPNRRPPRSSRHGRRHPRCSCLPSPRGRLAPPTGSAGHAPASAKANANLTFHPGHSMGADQSLLLKRSG